MNKWSFDPSSRENALCRARVRYLDPIEFFLYHAYHDGYVKIYSHCSPNCFRLVCCGRLIARSATYQGV